MYVGPVIPTTVTESVSAQLLLCPKTPVKCKVPVLYPWLSGSVSSWFHAHAIDSAVMLSFHISLSELMFSSSLQIIAHCVSVVDFEALQPNAAL